MCLFPLNKFIEKQKKRNNPLRPPFVVSNLLHQTRSEPQKLQRENALDLQDLHGGSSQLVSGLTVQLSYSQFYMD